ncbi:MAG: metal ABC transporter substrate-binding protein [Eubacteriales bacterium]|nr:metal ABC transporter substrate-binding protein [Eubacteriales bacterium]
MKKWISVCLTAVLGVSCLAGFGGNSRTSVLERKASQEMLSNQKDSVSEEKGLKVVATIFPEYDWVKEILGEHVDNTELTLLLGNGVDLHSYQPTVDDILQISTCDLFLYVGGESDSWVDAALAEGGSEDRKVINLLETLGEAAKEEQLVEGMEGEEHDHEEGEEGHDHQSEEEHEHEDEEHDHGEEPEYDEHVWLSLRNARVFTEAIAQALGELDPVNAEDYRANAEAYGEKLLDLDQDYQKVVDEAEEKTVLFGDRFPFRYLVDDYGLSYYAAFLGCSAETEASFETITFLSQKMDELDLRCVFTLENSDQRIASTIVENTKKKDQKLLVMDSMQSETAEDEETYLSIMEKNLEALKEALE